MSIIVDELEDDTDLDIQEKILLQLKIANMYLSQMTGETFTRDDIEDDE